MMSVSFGIPLGKKRDKSMVKCKHQQTLDMFCVDIFLGTPPKTNMTMEKQP